MSRPATVDALDVMTLANAGHTAYHGVFTSCNRAFKLQERDRTSWCADCPKCRFVFLCLGPFLGRDDLELYEEQVVVEFVTLLRPTVRFDGVDALIAQMHLDVRDAAAALGTTAV